jgi:ribosome biogenesis GTPase / thiamine phosphate phosphatase
MDDSRLTVAGWNETWAQAFAPWAAQGMQPARVAVEEKHFYRVLTASGDYLAQVFGKMLHQAASSADLPKVGDWVAVQIQAQERKALIRGILPRKTWLSRKAAGRDLAEQLLVTNIDTVFIVQGMDREWNGPLLQRHLLMVTDGGARPVLLLNKADLCSQMPPEVSVLQHDFAQFPAYMVSARTGLGMEKVRESIGPVDTVAFIGPSGVGKSSLINCLCGEEVQATVEVREQDAKGRHTTSWRELIVLPQGGCVIDTPGMREFHMWLAATGVSQTFPDIDALAVQCRFRDCGHAKEKDCAVQAAVQRGELSPSRLQSFLKLQREQDFLAQAHHRPSLLYKRRNRRGIGHVRDKERG